MLNASVECEFQDQVKITIGLGNRVFVQWKTYLGLGAYDDEQCCNFFWSHCKGVANCTLIVMHKNYPLFCECNYITHTHEIFKDTLSRWNFSLLASEHCQLRVGERFIPAPSLSIQVLNHSSKPCIPPTFFRDASFWFKYMLLFSQCKNSKLVLFSLNFVSAYGGNQVIVKCIKGHMKFAASTAFTSKRATV